MNAKILNRLIVAVIALLTVCPVLADTGSSQNSGTPGNGSAKLKQQSPCPKAKRMPSSLYLEVVYEYGTLTILSDCYEGEFSLSFENSVSGETCEVPSISVGASIPLELSGGEYEVTAVSADGIVLFGLMEVF